MKSRISREQSAFTAFEESISDLIMCSLDRFVQTLASLTDIKNLPHPHSQSLDMMSVNRWWFSGDLKLIVSTGVSQIQVTN